jgi:hypothetical protein
MAPLENNFVASQGIGVIFTLINCCCHEQKLFGGLYG